MNMHTHIDTRRSATTEPPFDGSTKYAGDGEYALSTAKGVERFNVTWNAEREWFDFRTIDTGECAVSMSGYAFDYQTIARADALTVIQ